MKKVIIVVDKSSEWNGAVDSFEDKELGRVYTEEEWSDKRQIDLPEEISQYAGKAKKTFVEKYYYEGKYDVALIFEDADAEEFINNVDVKNVEDYENE